MWWNGGYGGPGWGGWLVMALTMVAFWGLLVVAGVAVWRTAGRGARPDRGDDLERTPQRLLDERLARGEIDEDEYRRRRELLRSGR